MNWKHSLEARRIRLGLVLAASAAIAALGCDKGPSPSGEGPAASTAKPTATAASPAATAAAPAAAAAASSKCPDGMKGVGTQMDPCVAPGAKRFIELTYTGKD